MAAHERMVILAADDDPDDVLPLKQAFHRNAIKNPVHACANGAEAIAYLRGEGQFADRAKFPFPHFFFTDLKMPSCRGFELLEGLQNHLECGVMPAIALSGSALDIDVKKAYFQKPSSFDDLVSLVKSIHDFWARGLAPQQMGHC